MHARSPLCAGSVVSFAVLATWAGPATAQGTLESDDLQPRHYASRSGTFDLYVDPVDRRGHGPAKYELRRDGEIMWAAEKPFALWEAAVSDEGVAIGYAYSTGPSPDATKVGAFRVVVISARGETLREEVHERTPCTYPHGPANPFARRVFVHDGLRRGVVCIVDEDVNRSSAKWWTYDLATGENLKRFRPTRRVPGSDPLRGVVQAIPLPDTPLTLVHWYRYDSKGFGLDSDIGARFSLLDDEWRSVWELDLPRDYNVERDPDAEWQRLLGKVKYEGAILAVSSPARFEIRVCAENERVTLTAERGEREGEWTVRELAREPFQERTTEAVTLPEIHLERLASVTLGRSDERASGPIRDIVDFAVTPKGAIRFVRREDERGAYSIVRVDAKGRAGSEVAVDPLDAWSIGVRWAPLSENGWIVTASDTELPERSRAWHVDGATGDRSLLEGFDCPSVETIVATGDGGFVVLGRHQGEYSSTDALFRFDRAGRRLWTVGSDSEDETKLFSAQDVAVTTKGLVVVTDNIRKVLQVYGPDGQFRDKVDLKRVFGSEPNYPAEIRADVGGGVVVHDYRGPSSVWRIDLDGTVRARFDVSDPEGLTAGHLEYDLRVAPDGTLWSTDRRLFARLDARGVVEGCVGEWMDPERLYEPSPAVVDGRGHVLIQDRRTWNVHVFDGDGRRVRVCRSAPRYASRIAVAGDGSVLVDGLSFGPDGERREKRELGRALLAFLPEGAGYWGIDDRGLVRIGDEGETERVVERRPDNRFFRAYAGAVAPDGSLLVVDQLRDLVPFDPEGRPQRVLTLPGRRAVRSLGWSGRRAVVGSWGPEALLVDLETDSIQRFVFADERVRGSTFAYGLSADGEELWVVESTPPTLHRFALP